MTNQSWNNVKNGAYEVVMDGYVENKDRDYKKSMLKREKRSWGCKRDYKDIKEMVRDLKYTKVLNFELCSLLN